MTDICLYLDGKQRCNDGDKCMSIRKVQEIIGSDIFCQILVLHAFSGCDTTSAIIGHGKGNVLCKWSSKCSARNCISVMQNPGVSVAAVSEAGQ